MSDQVTITFINMDAKPKVVTGTVGKDMIRNVMAWYGAYYSGDRYRVEINGEVVKKDQNGELVEPTT